MLEHRHRRPETGLNGEEKDPRDLLKTDFEGFHGRFLIEGMKAREGKFFRFQLRKCTLKIDLY